MPEGSWPASDPPLAPLRPLVEAPSTDPQPEPDGVEAPVIFQPVRCPRCRSKRTLVKSSRPPVRHHKCSDCGENFKSVEQE